VHPSEPGDIAAAILDIVGSDTLAAELRAKGLARARSFPWSRTAEAMAEIYRQAAGTKG
jgi:glycosyltransferase involved in cell wall biosynthesis